jgi:hypothetical protein
MFHQHAAQLTTLSLGEEDPSETTVPALSSKTSKSQRIKSCLTSTTTTTISGRPTGNSEVE